MEMFKELTDALGSDSEEAQSWRWSIKSVTSTSRENGPDGQITDTPISPELHQVGVETLARLPKGRSALQLHTHSSTDEGFHERQVKCAQEGSDLDILHVAAIATLVQQCCDIIAQDHPRADAQAEMLLGLQIYMKGSPAPGIPADLHADLEPNQRPRTPCVLPLEIDDGADELPINPYIQEVYATAYQMRSVGTMPLNPVEAETMRREAAMDDAVFRPYRRSGMTVLSESRRTREVVGAVTVQKQIRKRKREGKDLE